MPKLPPIDTNISPRLQSPQHAEPNAQRRRLPQRLPQLQRLLNNVLRFLLPIATVATVYLYLYPIFHGCAFPSIIFSDRDINDVYNPRRHATTTRTSAQVLASFRDTLSQHLPVSLGPEKEPPLDKSAWRDAAAGGSGGAIAPFRLLVLADPQIEGDSSLPKEGFWERLRVHWGEVVGGSDGWDLEESHEDGQAEGEEGEGEGGAPEAQEGSVEEEEVEVLREGSGVGRDDVQNDDSNAGEGSTAGDSEADTSTDAETDPESTAEPDSHAEAGETGEAVGLRTERRDPASHPPPSAETVALKPSRPALAFQALQTILARDIPDALNAARKRIDLFGNDYYLAHIYRTLNWWAIPSHVTVLGDLIGSQWVKDDEFEWRGWRYWNRVMFNGQRIDESITTLGDEAVERAFSIDDPAWKRRVVNIAGNHDIGYAGDISKERIERFERVFGKANWDVRFEYPVSPNASEDEARPPSLHLINLNSLVLDTPALDSEIQSATYAYMNSIITNRMRPVEDQTSFTLMLTHLPLFKKAGICVDAPHFEFWGNDDGGGMYKPWGLKEQNHLSRHASEPGMLESMFGMKGDIAAAGQGKGRHGLILNGHDHEGCDTWHYIHVNRTWNSSEEDPPTDRKTQWHVARTEDAEVDVTYTGIREITLRSMMGEFGGNAGLLSAWYDFEVKSWRYEFQTCSLGVQHVWWAVHILDLVALVLAACALCLRVVTVPAHKKKDLQHVVAKQSMSNGSMEKKGLQAVVK